MVRDDLVERIDEWLDAARRRGLSLTFEPITGGGVVSASGLWPSGERWSSSLRLGGVGSLAVTIASPQVVGGMPIAALGTVVRFAIDVDRALWWRRVKPEVRRGS